MGKRRSMMIKKKYNDRNTIKLWSDLNRDVQLLIMMKLGVVDFIAFSRVCKSWRLLAISNKNNFIVSKPPMSISFSVNDANEKECYLEDFEGRKLKASLPHLTDRTCIGVTCGYLILFRKKTSDIWLVNPITRHELHFLDVPYAYFHGPQIFKTILVFSPSISGFVFVMFNRLLYKKIWLCIEGTREWTYISTTFPICDLITFKGKIYTAHYVMESDEVKICEMKLYPEPILVLLETEGNPKPDFRYPGFVKCGENLYMIDRRSEHPYKIHEIDLEEMKLVSCEKAGDEYGFFVNQRAYVVAVKNGKGGLFRAEAWYFLDDCLNVNLIHE